MSEVFSVEQQDGLTTLSFSVRELNRTNSERFLEDCAEVPFDQTKKIALDLSEVSFIDSKGMSALLEFQIQISNEDITISLLNLTAKIRQIFISLGIDHYFEINE